MKLYRIRRKDNGQCFLSWRPYSTEPYWTDTGAFFKKIDTVAKHLELLASDWFRHIGSLGFPSDLKRARLTIKRTYRKRLKLYEVVVSNVTVRGEEIIAAEDIVK